MLSRVLSAEVLKKSMTLFSLFLKSLRNFFNLIPTSPTHQKLRMRKWLMRKRRLMVGAQILKTKI